jgi:uncharacterized protein (DUF2336 family)
MEAGDDAASLDASVFDDVLMRGGADARKELARQLAAFLPSSKPGSRDRETVVAKLIKLATDPVAEVRESLARQLSQLAPLEADILFTIIADDDFIALPFLASTPALDRCQMLAVLKIGDLARQLQVASRPDLCPECIDYMIEAADWPVCASLLDNEAFEPVERDYRRLYARFAGEPEIVERLLARQDIPLVIRIVEAKRTSNRIQEYLENSALMTDDDGGRLVAAAEETATLRVLAAANEAELDQVLPFLLNKKLLTPSLILRAAVVGEMRFIDRALSLLSGIPLQRVQGLLYQRGSPSFRALFSRCGLPAGCFHLMRAAIAVECGIRESGEDVSSDAFGSRVVESIMAGFDGITMDEKLKLLSYVAEFGTDRPQAIAARLQSTLNRAA